MKECRDCKVIKPFEQLVKHPKCKDGYNSLCLECNYLRVKAWRKQNSRTAQNNRYKEKNPGSANARAKKYHMAKAHRLVSWADVKEIEFFYNEAIRLAQETGIPHHVDHIIPLQGRNVSGLHVHNNLQVIPASVNRSKYNSFEGY